jgi:hypothetical protein
MMLFLLLAGHAVCDYPLQGDFLARGKNHRRPIPGVPWWQCLFAHAMIHGGAVALITNNVWLGLAETLVHIVIDFGKCSNWYGFNADQTLHVLCKLLWAVFPQ